MINSYVRPNGLMTYKKQNLETEDNANYQKRLKEYEVHKIQNIRETLFRA